MAHDVRVAARRRRRGDGTVFYDHAEKVWVARVSLGTRNGKRIRHKERASTERGARAALEGLQRAYGAAADPATMTLHVYLESWLGSHAVGIRPSTLRSYRGHVANHIAPLLGGIIVAKLRPADVRRLIAQVLTVASPSTAGHVVTTLRIALGAAVAERSLVDNAAAVRLPKVERDPIRPLTGDEARKVSVAIAGDRYEALYRLLMGSGMRLGEATGLDWRDVHLDEAFVVVRRSKTKARAVPISADAVVALRAHREAAKVVGAEIPVFIGPRTGERLPNATISHAFPRLLLRAGLRRMRVHDLRHGVATTMLAAGVPMRVIAEQLGHANPAMTAKVYAHVIPESQRAAIGSLDDVLRRAQGG